MKTYRIAVLPGDGIGPEVTKETLKALEAVEQIVSGIRFEFDEFSVGAGEYLNSGDPLPPGNDVSVILIKTDEAPLFAVIFGIVIPEMDNIMAIDMEMKP